MGTPHGAGTPGSDAGSTEAVIEAAREVLAGLANQIDGLAGLFAPGSAAGSLAEGIAAEVTGDIAALFAEAGELLARLIATLIAILEALVALLRSPSADSAAQVKTAYQDIAVAIGGDQP
ncbi:hypothetical protein HUN08_10655 [Gordonia sp. X0973]|uniref:hypothetical protein n=1 Tax=Gordonia sp. X0973 TaxID=2742602 RepID=UPI000F530B90|nr:hypothetical protein [Gordonia sp. X0973]QKT07602.1 hypothetical protein HUN08_10655 [Gordonia sp. X0973]